MEPFSMSHSYNANDELMERKVDVNDLSPFFMFSEGRLSLTDIL